MSNLSFVKYIGDGTKKQFLLPMTGDNIGYLRTGDIRVYVDSEEVTFNIELASPHFAILDTAPEEGALILIRRQMPQALPYADFTGGNRFTPENVNNSFLQLLYLTQELLDGFIPEGTTQKQDMDFDLKYLPVNLKDPLEPNDAANKQYVDVVSDRVTEIENTVVAGDTRYIRTVYKNGSADGGELFLTVPYAFESINNVIIGGLVQTQGLAWDYDVDLQHIELAEELLEGDEVVIEVGLNPEKVLDNEIVSGDAEVVSTGTTTPRTLADRFGDIINVKDFNDDVIEAANLARTTNKKLYIPYGEYNLAEPLNVCGLHIIGDRVGFNEGTTLIFDRSYDGLIQQTNGLGDITYHIENIIVKEADWGLKMRYSVGSTIKNLSVLDSNNGVMVGEVGTLGPLFNYFENLWVDVDEVALSLGGDDFCNANQFNTAFLRGHTNTAAIGAGGLGALSNTFTNVEFRGDNLGVIFGSSKSTQFYGCYFECEAPAIKIAGFSQDILLSSCVYGTLVNTNSEGVSSFIWHESGAASVSVEAGYITLGKTDGTQDNLRFITSDDPAFLKYECDKTPDTEIISSGWAFYGTGLPTDRFSIKFSEPYTSIWTGQGGTQPNIGDGTIESYYHLHGNMCTAYIELTYGSTTTSGNGAYQLSLPFEAANEATGSSLVLETGVGYDSGVCKVNQGSSLLVMYPSNGNIVSNVSPIIWSDGDKISASITYRIN